MDPFVRDTLFQIRQARLDDVKRIEKILDAGEAAYLSRNHKNDRRLLKEYERATKKYAKAYRAYENFLNSHN